MFLKAAQHQSKCYCNSVGSTCCNSHVNCFKRKTTGSGSVFNVTAKCKQDKTNYNKRTAERCKPKTDFVKINRKATGASAANRNRRGLGHSQSHSVANAAATNFSRRNSAATTVTFSTPCATPAGTHSSAQTTPSPSPITILKAAPVTMAALGDNFRALSVSAKSEGGSDFNGALKHEYTQQRRYYESAKQLMKLISSQRDNVSPLNIVSGIGGCVDTCASDAAMDAERLHALQQFRLQNADDCFSVHRQLDLQLPAKRKELERRADERHTRKLWSALLERGNVARSEEEKSVSEKRMKSVSCKPTRNIAACQARGIAHLEGSAKKIQSPALTPYAVRQKLLQLRLEAEEIGRMKPGRKRYGALEKSCALRYQETY